MNKKNIFCLLFIFIVMFIIIFIPLNITSEIFFKPSTIQNNEIIWSGEILIDRYFVIPENTTLIIKPGTVIKFKHNRDYKDLYSRSGLAIYNSDIIAKGNAKEQIWFTSDAPNPINGDWEGITIENSKNSKLDYVIVEYAMIGIEQFDSEVEITNSIIRWNNTEGLYAERSKPVIKNNTIYGNAYHEIALEQYNKNVQIINNIIKNGNYGIHCEKTEAYIIGNYIYNERFLAITAGMESQLSIVGNKFEEIGNEIFGISNDSVSMIKDNDYGDGTNFQIPEFDYEDVMNSKLDYIPGDTDDKFKYVYDIKDNTREIVDRKGKDLSFGWALTYAEDYLWKFSIGHGEIGEQLDFIRIDPVKDNEYKYYGNDVIMNPRGLIYDGEYFWVNDFSLLKLFKFKLGNKYIEIVDSFDIPEKENGGTGGLTYDGEYLYLISRDGSKFYRINKKGMVIDEIYFNSGGVGHGITYVDGYFWTTYGCSKGLCKFNSKGELVGGIYAPAWGTTALTWDGEYLWTLNKTCELWNDEKIFKIQILNDK